MPYTDKGTPKSRQTPTGNPYWASSLNLNISATTDSREELNHIKEETNTAVHFLSPDQLAALFRTDLQNGHTQNYAEEMQHIWGPNKLHKRKGNSRCKIFTHNLFGWFQCVLWAGAALTLIAYFFTPDHDGHSSKEYLYLCVIITITVVGNGLFGFYQESKNLAVMSGFEKMVPPYSNVTRDGVMKSILNEDVVVGDIVEMNGGETVPADVRILECTNFKTDMASLMGESLPVSHTPDCTHANPLESRNMAYFGCPIVEGRAKGIVVDTGEMTQIGKIAGLVTGLEKVQTPLNKEITYFVKTICAVAFGFGIMFFTLVMIVQRDFIHAFLYMLGIILANVPEGLLVTLTVCMTLSAKQLRMKNCLAKTLHAVETLGSTSAICSDKTGTLTQNQMSVSHMLCDFQIYEEDDHEHSSDAPYSDLCLAACLNLKATFVEDEENDKLPINSRKIKGDASEAAILRYMEINRSATKVRKHNPKVAEIPFSSVYKYQVTIHHLHNSDGYYLTMKGAPEIVLEHCATVLTSRGVANVMELTPETKKELGELFIQLANMGERLLGYGELKLPVGSYPLGFQFNTEEVNFPVENLKFVGAISMIDPPRLEVPKAIQMCRRAGIKVTMVTGDHPVTALAISRKIGTITHPTAYDYAFEHHIELKDVSQHVRNQFKSAVFTGDDLRKMTAADLKLVLQKYHEVTFARTSPLQKLFIVENYQALQYVVAVTGDGVNDSPALKKADIGIAMGITGTEVSKQAADMILLDDNFASIVLGVEEGRRVFDNLKKTIAYTLTSNTPEMMPFVLYAVVGLPLPLTLILILMINIVTDLLPAVSLAYETCESDIMKIPPRKTTDHLVTRGLIFMAYFQVGLIQFLAGMYAYFVIFAQHGFFPTSLFFVRDNWDDSAKTVKNSYGDVYGFDERKRFERSAQTGYFVATCWTQISDVIICKTRRISLLKKGMKNCMLNVSIVLNLFVTVLVCYMPFCNEVLSTEPIEWYEMLLAVPFMILMVVGDELRRFLIRRNYSKWLEDETYY